MRIIKKQSAQNNTNRKTKKLVKPRPRQSKRIQNHKTQKNTKSLEQWIALRRLIELRKSVKNINGIVGTNLNKPVKEEPVKEEEPMEEEEPEFINLRKSGKNINGIVDTNLNKPVEEEPVEEEPVEEEPVEEEPVKEEEPMEEEEPEFINFDTELRGVMYKETEEYLKISKDIDKEYEEQMREIEKNILKYNEDIIRLENELTQKLGNVSYNDYIKKHQGDNKDEITPLKSRISIDKNFLESLNKDKESLSNKIQILKKIAKLEIKRKSYHDEILEISASDNIDDFFKNEIIIELNLKKNIIEEQIDELNIILNPKPEQKTQRPKPRPKPRTVKIGSIYMRPKNSKSNPIPIPKPRGRRTKGSVIGSMASHALSLMAQNYENQAMKLKRTGSNVPNQIIQNTSNYKPRPKPKTRRSAVTPH